MKLLISFGIMAVIAGLICSAIFLAPKIHLGAGGPIGEVISAIAVAAAGILALVLAVMWLALPLIVYFGFRRVEERLDRLSRRDS